MIDKNDDFPESFFTCNIFFRIDEWGEWVETFPYSNGSRTGTINTIILSGKHNVRKFSY